MPHTNHEALQPLHLLIGVLLPDLQAIDLTPVTIKPPIDLLKVPFHHLGSCLHRGDCQEIGLVAIMFFFILLFSYVSLSISFYVSIANLFSIILFPYLLITRDVQDKGKARI